MPVNIHGKGRLANQPRDQHGRLVSPPFASRIHLSPKLHSCWIWTGARTAGGYGYLRPGGKRIYAHRAAYELYVGVIPEGMEIDHLCRSRACVNPNHLEVVTHRENGLRGVGACALNAAKTHCKRGHPFDAENTVVVKRGRGHECRQCKRASEKRRYDARRAQSCQ